MAGSESSPSDAGVLLRQLIPFANRGEGVIPLLQKAQSIVGYLSPEALEAVAEAAGVPLSQVWGVATFYSHFRHTPGGRHRIRICHGTACHVAGAGRLEESLCRHLGAESGETTEDGLFSVESVACLGCCSLAPVIMVDNETFGRLDGETASRVVEAFRVREENRVKEGR